MLKKGTTNVSLPIKGIRNAKVFSRFMIFFSFSIRHSMSPHLMLAFPLFRLIMGMGKRNLCPEGLLKY